MRIFNYINRPSRTWAKNLNSKSKSLASKIQSSSSSSSISSSASSSSSTSSSSSASTTQDQSISSSTLPNSPPLLASSLKIDKKATSYNKFPSTCDASLDVYSVIQNRLLVSFLSKTKCELCEKQWNGNVQMNKREGLFIILSFQCSYCKNIIVLS